MRQKNFLYLIVCCLISALSSCSTSRLAKKNVMIGNMTTHEYVAHVIDSTPSWNLLSGKVAVSLYQDNKKLLKFNGSLRMKRGEAILLSVAPILGIEVVRAEITPQSILILDRVHKRYAKIDFSELYRLLNVNVDFSALQALFYNELFLPGKKNLRGEDAIKFKAPVEEGQVKLEPKVGRRFQYTFFTSPGEGFLRKSSIGLRNTEYALQWRYSDFQPFENRVFPRKMNVAVEGLKKHTMLSFNFSRLSLTGKCKLTDEVPTRYNRIELTELLKLLQQK